MAPKVVTLVSQNQQIQRKLMLAAWWANIELNMGRHLRMVYKTLGKLLKKWNKFVGLELGYSSSS